MDSRPVTLLTRGYLLGWLDFKYKHPFSRLRERLILREVERDLLKDIIQLRVTTESSLLSSVVGHNKKALDIPYDGLEQYTQLILPYEYKKSKMNVEDVMANKDYWVNFLKEKQKAFDAAKAKEQNK